MLVVNKYLLLFGIKEPEIYFSNSELNYIYSILSSKKEKDRINDLDEWGNINENGYENIEIPYLDNFVLNKLNQFGVYPKTIWPNDHKFAICLTHDIDAVESYSPKVFKRNIAKRYKYTESTSQKLKLAFQYLKNLVKQLVYIKKNDPAWHFEDWIEAEERYGLNSTYFFYIRPEKGDLQTFDCDYYVSDKFKFENKFITIKDFIVELYKKGNEIGLHGSYKSATEQRVFQAQKDFIEKIINKKISSTRQHFLHYHPEQTPNIHAANDIITDSTLGLNKSTGYRHGTSMPFIIEANEAFVWELPLIFMDSSVFGAQKMSLEEAKEKVCTYVQQIEKTGGCFTVNFHPFYSYSLELYKYVLDLGIQKNAYIGTCSKIIEFVKKLEQ